MNENTKEILYKIVDVAVIAAGLLIGIAACVGLSHVETPDLDGFSHFN